ncbi:MAG: YggS family pyridoxal phosphate-dependent enzyme [Candidatus Bipolaricaulota bacterium]|nr:YggS family pyridoxal phosphate-dependent enzyme [Candidatus Bipolaricaulota bacterium]
MIKDNVKKILDQLPDNVTLVAAAKTRTPEEILEAIEAGVSAIGENYIQEAEQAHSKIGSRARWHFIGHLQRNKVKKAVHIFDMIETVDSPRLAAEIDKRCARIGRTMPVLIEVNSGREPQKMGVPPEDVQDFIKGLSRFERLKPMGLMTMGPRFGNPEKARPYFQRTREIFDSLARLKLENTDWRYLSMGMSNTYEIAIEEGANMVRIGTRLFGKRDYEQEG